MALEKLVSDFDINISKCVVIGFEFIVVPGSSCGCKSRAPRR